MKRKAAWITAGLLLTTTSVTTPPAQARCEEEHSYAVDEVSSPDTQSTASPTGHYNDSNETSKLGYELSTTKSRATYWSVGGGGKIGWAIFEVEAHTDYDVTNSVDEGVKVSTDLSVPGKHYGYVQPKVEVRQFRISYGRVGRDCKWHEERDHGILSAITGWPFFSTCVDRSACIPKP